MHTLDLFTFVSTPSLATRHDGAYLRGVKVDRHNVVGAGGLKHVCNQSCADRRSRLYGVSHEPPNDALSAMYLVFFVLTGVWEIRAVDVSTGCPYAEGG